LLLLLLYLNQVELLQQLKEIAEGMAYLHAEVTAKLAGVIAPATAAAIIVPLVVTATSCGPWQPFTAQHKLPVMLRSSVAEGCKPATGPYYKYASNMLTGAALDQPSIC
jgi:hypothetical protein